MFTFDEEAHISHVRIVDECFKRVIRRRWNVVLVAIRQPPRGAVLFHTFGANGEVFGSVCKACRHRVKARVIFQFRAADGVEQRKHLRIGIRRK